MALFASTSRWWRKLAPPQVPLAWAVFRRLPLTEEEFAVVASNLAPYLRWHPPKWRRGSLGSPDFGMPPLNRNNLWRHSPRDGCMLLWIAAGAVPLLLLPLAAQAVIALVGAVSLGAPLFLLFIVLFGGGQALVLRTYVPWSGGWFAFSLAGCVAAMVATLAVLRIVDPLGLPEVMILTVLHGVGGIVVGAAQWLTLRRHVVGAWVWIPINRLLWAAFIAGGIRCLMLRGRPAACRLASRETTSFGNSCAPRRPRPWPQGPFSFTC